MDQHAQTPQQAIHRLFLLQLYVRVGSTSKTARFPNRRDFFGNRPFINYPCRRCNSYLGGSLPQFKGQSPIFTPFRCLAWKRPVTPGCGANRSTNRRSGLFRI